ncbi:hypothetical protein HPB51_019162 [Rhipicephalus microplus]|uniref:Uncharacterized protein n=1 Tax=Rhipicephalus microplus TaxID=6941 RepID=A0A9J6EB80_RHIMP|nr:hypothetical protein HPB51_019162 [Rhipicephalus microplus]
MKIVTAANIIAEKADRLVTDDTSNLAEAVIVLVAKLSGGKQTNRCQKGSYEHRCYGAGLSFQLGPQWHCTTSKALTCKSPAAVLTCYVSKKTAQKANKESLRGKLFGENGHQQHKRKESTVNDSMIHYGPNCQQPDMPPEQYAEKQRAVLASLQVNEKQQMEIEKATRGQADNPTWHFERNMHLTASNFYAVCRRREWTPCDTLVKTLLYKKNFTSAALEHAWKTTGTCRTPVIRARNGNCCATLRVICLPRVRILGGVARRIDCERRYRGGEVPIHCEGHGAIRGS